MQLLIRNMPISAQCGLAREFIQEPICMPHYEGTIWPRDERIRDTITLLKGCKRANNEGIRLCILCYRLLPLHTQARVQGNLPQGVTG